MTKLNHCDQIQIKGAYKNKDVSREVEVDKK